MSFPPSIFCFCDIFLLPVYKAWIMFPNFFLSTFYDVINGSINLIFDYFLAYVQKDNLFCVLIFILETWLDSCMASAGTFVDRVGFPMEAIKSSINIILLLSQAVRSLPQHLHCCLHRAFATVRGGSPGSSQAFSGLET